ncbi:hypothetical protein F4861DRAFT_226769 [Xylaria intraflava]|nr:hypothetical protein F4861DRAFT_226769 [Xylaria intraflava]
MRKRIEAETRASEARVIEELKEVLQRQAEQDKKHEDQIQLKDALGRMISIPYRRARTWKGMEELIASAFRSDEDFKPWIMAGNFDLIGPSGIILPQAWGDTIQPGWRIMMLMWPQAVPTSRAQMLSRAPQPPQPFPPSRPFPPHLRPPPRSSENVDAGGGFITEDPSDQAESSSEQTTDNGSSYDTTSSSLRGPGRSIVAGARSLFNIMRPRPSTPQLEETT